MSGDDAAPTVVITGAAGYIGSRVAVLLQETHPEWELVLLDNFYTGDVRTIGDVDVEHVDVRHRPRLETTLAGADLVLHLAAMSDIHDCADNQDLAYEVNVQGTANVAWWCRKSGAGLVFPFSMAVLGSPERFPITIDQQRQPANWYARTKLMGERLIEDMADGAFPAHLYLKSNLYGEHQVGARTVSKGTVINFFVNRVLNGEPITVYEPGTQSRNYVHVDDVARAYVRSSEVLLDELDRDETGVDKYELASREDPSVMAVAKLVQRVAAEEHGREVGIDLVENPRTHDRFVEEFTVDISRTTAALDWEPRRSIEGTVRDLFSDEWTPDSA
jgi:UDP-glucose 4-epimerase